MSMGKKDFIELADCVKRDIHLGVQAKTRDPKLTSEVMLVVTSVLANYCVQRSKRFNRQLWLDYVRGVCKTLAWPASEEPERERNEAA
jgi:hypothetical protein